MTLKDFVRFYLLKTKEVARPLFFIWPKVKKHFHLCKYTGKMPKVMQHLTLTLLGSNDCCRIS